MKFSIFALALLLFANAIYAATFTLPLNDPCDISHNEVAPGFRGHDTNALAQSLESVNITKDKYESEQAFAERIQNALNSMPRAISEGSLCVVGQNFVHGENTKYNTETETLWVYIFLKYPQIWIDGSKVHDDFQILVNEKNLKDSSYVGTNAFGVSTRVSKSKRLTIYVSFDRLKAVSVIEKAGAGDVENMFLALPLHVSAAKARSMDGTIRVAYRYKLLPPLLASDDSYETPTLDSPYEDEEKKTLVVASLTGVMVFDDKTGEVLRSLGVPESESPKQ